MVNRYSFIALAFALACGSSGQAPLDPSTGGPKAFTLAFTSAGDGSLTAAGTFCRAARCTASVASGTQITIAAAPDSGAWFAGFSGDCSGMTCTLTMDADHSVGGSFSHSPPPSGKARLAVHVEGQGSAASTPAGIDCGAICSALFDTGTFVTLRSTAAAGWHFVGWGRGCSGPGACAFVIGSDTDVYVKFEADPPAPAKLTVAVTGGGSVRSTPAGIDCPGTCQGSFAPGTAVSLTATPAAGGSFKEWSGACSGAAPRCDLTVTSAAQVGATFLTAPPDECAGLRPPDPGPAPHKYSTSFEHGGSCLPAADTDGAGTLPLTAFAPDAGHTDFVDPSGTLLSTRAGSGYHPYVGLLSGFEKVNASSTYSWLEAFDTGGHLTAQTPSRNAVRLVRADPIAGVVSRIQDVALDQTRLEGYDEHLALRWSVTLPGNQYALLDFGVDRKGRTLAMFWGDAIFGPGSIAAEWIDHAGVASAPFAWGVPNWTSLEPRVEGGFFIRSKAGFVAQIDSGAITTTPAPAWLQTITAWSSFHMVHGGRGYAVIPAWGSPQSCAQTIEVRAPSGKSCGRATFALGPGACMTKGITVGYDGTVVQQFPDSAEQQRSDGQATCTWQWWPGFFK